MIFWPGQDGGFLGRTADPWLIRCDPSSPDFHCLGYTPHTDMHDPLGRPIVISRGEVIRQAV